MLFRPTKPKRPAEAEAPLPKLSSQRWRDTLIPDIERKLAEAKARDAALVEDHGPAELALALDLEGAKEEVIKVREQRRLLSIEIEGLEGALRQANSEMAAAQQTESVAKNERRIEDLKILAKQRLSLAAQIDEWLRQGNLLAHNYLLAGLEIGRYRDLDAVDPRIRGPSSGRLQSSELTKRAVANAGDAVAAFFDSGHCARDQRVSLREMEKGLFANILVYETAIGREAAELEAIEEEVLKEHPELEIDLMHEYPEGEPERMLEEVKKLVDAKRDARSAQSKSNKQQG